MKILFSDNTLWGLLNFRGSVIRKFIERGHEVVLVAPRDELCDEGIPRGARYVEIELSRTGTNPVSDLKYLYSLRKIYWVENPDYIIHYTIKPNIYGTLAARSLNIRSSAMVAGVGHVFTRNTFGNRLARAMYKYAMRYPERVLVLNRANLDTLVTRHVVGRDKLFLMRGGEGVDLARYAFLPMPSNDRPVFLMICRLLYEKGYAEYVAAAEALGDVAEFRLMGPLDNHPSAVKKETLENDVRRGVIRYAGYSSGVEAQVSGADCLVLPSWHEGLSRVLMEGAAMGRPLIASDIAGCRETVDDGVNGYLVAPKNAGELIEACRRFVALTRAERERMGDESRAKAERQFDIDDVFEVYESMVEAT
jgi:glycosyltransferase involved in cell wall biosynthesis